ncbi:MAG: protein kinase, partial [Myxococcales bacterium]|nr:protein kinase [Myxococcales bacterium]
NVPILLNVAQAIAFAHSRGIIHRDIKPAQVMVGAFGEVLLMDWGLAWRFRTPAPEDAAPAALDATARLRPRSGSSGSERFTGTGTLIGSPPYMAPEQLDPSRALVGPPADVYALGGTLYQIVTGRLPRLNQSDAIAGLLRRDPVVLTEGPEELQRIASRALAQDIDARYPDAGPLAEAVRAWLDDEARRARARSVLSDAVRLEPEAAALRAEAAALYAEAHALLDALPPHASVERKAAGWALQDTAADRLRTARLTEVRAAEAVQAALRIAPDLPEARAHLTLHFRQRLTAAEAERDADTAAEYAQRLRLHDPEGSAEWLRGDGRLTLITEPPGARARLFRHVLDRRRLVPEFVADLPPTPIIDHPLPMGSHVIELT